MACDVHRRGEVVTALVDLGPLEELEADVRKRMARLTQARGFDTQKIRDAEVAAIDLLLDQWNALAQ